MITLEKPIRIDKSFIITSMVEKALVQNDMAGNDEQWIEIQGYASRMYHVDGGLVIDSQGENVDTWGIDLTRLKNGILPILFNHDQDKAVGSVLSATYDKDGLLITAKIFKYKDDRLTNFIYNSVKSGVIRAFSVGIIVKAFDMVNVEDEDYLQISRSECIEVSLVAVPANAEALFQMTNLKGMGGNATLLKKADLKAMGNPEVCDGFSCAFNKHQESVAQKEIEMVTKNEEVDKATVIAITDAASEQLDELLAPEPEVVASSEEDSETKEGTTIISGEADKIVDPNDKPSDEPQEDLQPEPAEPTITEKVNALMAIDVSQLSEVDLELVYEALSTIVDNIEARVVAEVVQELTTITAPAVN